MSSSDINKIIESFDLLLPYLRDLFEQEVVFEIVDREKCIRFIPHQKFPLEVTEGDRIPEGSVDHECQKTSKPVVKIVPKELYGFPLKVIASPLLDDNKKVLGSISIGRSLDKQDTVNGLATDLSGSLEAISSASNKLAKDIQELLDANQTILKNIQEASREAGEIDEVVNFIKNISSQTNLLGLNAAIEAARAGEQGRGFNIVAQQIRKLSTSSHESIEKVNSVLKNIQTKITEIAVDAEDTNKVLENQSTALQEITATIQQLNSTARHLKDMASQF